MKKEDAEEYTQSLGQIVGGSWRQIELAKKLGGSVAMCAWPLISDGKPAKELSDKGESTRAIGEVLGVDEKTVRNDRRAAENSAPAELEDSSDALADDESADFSAPIDAVAALAASDDVRAAAKAAQTHNHRAQGTGENEWYTPEKYIEAARHVLDGIDIDPASSASAQETVKAARFFSADDDGLSKKWRGRVWLNPPYSQPHIQQFTEKLVAEVVAGRTTAAIALTHNYTDTEWFHIAARACDAICFTRGRVRFVNPEGEEAAPEVFNVLAEVEKRLSLRLRSILAVRIRGSRQMSAFQQQLATGKVAEGLIAAWLKSPGKRGATGLRN